MFIFYNFYLVDFQLRIKHKHVKKAVIEHKTATLPQNSFINPNNDFNQN